MNCPNCKAEISDDMKFCIKCGTKIETPATEEKPVEAVAQIPKVNLSKPAEEKPVETAPPQAPAQEKPAETAQVQTAAQPALCAKCGAPLKEGTKFCT